MDFWIRVQAASVITVRKKKILFTPKYMHCVNPSCYSANLYSCLDEGNRLGGSLLLIRIGN